MKSVEELNSTKVPIVIIDKRLNKLDDIVLFPDKVEKAKDTIAKIGLPKSSDKPEICKNEDIKAQVSDTTMKP